MAGHYIWPFCLAEKQVLTPQNNFHKVFAEYSNFRRRNSQNSITHPNKVDLIELTASHHHTQLPHPFLYFFKDAETLRNNLCVKSPEFHITWAQIIQCFGFGSMVRRCFPRYASKRWCDQLVEIKSFAKHSQKRARLNFRPLQNTSEV